MLILGIDPGTATTGYGVLEVTNGNYHVIDFGLIETDKDGKPETRLVEIHNEIIQIISRHQPDIIAIERLFFATNAKTAMRVGQALGVMLFAAAEMKTQIIEYAPGTIKKIITGSGRADKKMVQQSLRKLLGAKVKSRAHKKTHFDNAADALAVAVCHATKAMEIV